ncbi:MAG: carboxypeptidase regulatory-like domain-containing protein [Ktedonobacteraceae bacterium]|nr:carboxypeptidase regulatory-like domain-containing protein [Ktedonobacteraceae bacterium]
MIHRLTYICLLSVLAVVVLIAASLVAGDFASAHNVQAAVRDAGNGRITGQLLDGTHKNAPLAGQSVTLQMAQGSSTRDLTSTTTDAHGTYTFSNLATDKTISYVVYIRYQGAQYISDVVSLAQKAEQQVNLTVYQATTDTSKLAIVQTTLLIREPDTKKGTITISEIYGFRNLDLRTYVGSLDASKGRPNALLFSLPRGARNVNLSKGFGGYKAIQVDGGFATDAAIPPGASEFSFAFEVPYTSSSYDLAYTARYPTLLLSVLVPPDIRTSSGSLTAQGVVNADQHAYRRLQTSQLLPGQEVHLNMEGLPLPASASAPSPINMNIVWLVVGIVIMIAILFVTAFLVRLQGRFFPAKKRSTRSSRARETSSERERTKSEEKETKYDSSRQKSKNEDEEEESDGRDPKERQQALLHKILELDKTYEDGKIKKTVYQEKRAKLKAQLRRLINEEKSRREASRR